MRSGAIHRVSRDCFCLIDQVRTSHHFPALFARKLIAAIAQHYLRKCRQPDAQRPRMQPYRVDSTQVYASRASSHLSCYGFLSNKLVQLGDRLWLGDVHFRAEVTASLLTHHCLHRFSIFKGVTGKISNNRPLHFLTGTKAHLKPLANFPDCLTGCWFPSGGSAATPNARCSHVRFSFF